MPPKKRSKRSFLNLIFRRNRRSQPDRSRSGSGLSFSKLSKSVKKSFDDSLKLLRKLFRQTGSSQLGGRRQGEVDAMSLGGLVRTLKAGVNSQFEDKNAQKKNSRSKRINRFFWTNSRRILLGSPALVAGIFCLSLILNYSPSRLVRQLGYTNRFDRALVNQDFRQAEILVKNQLSSMTRPLDQDLFRNALLLAADNKILQTRELLEYLTETSDRSYGPAHLELAKALLVVPDPNDEANLKIERHLLRAMVHPESELAARISLGKFYRLRGRFNDAERILEQVRTDEDGCIELGLVLHAQGHFDDIPTTLAPFISRWRDQWKAPKNIGQFEHAAIGLVLMNEEKSVIDGLNQPKIAVAPSRIDEMRNLALGLWLDRLLREGTSQSNQILQIVRTYHGQLSCSPVWIRPLMFLTESSNPVCQEALRLRNELTLNSNCDPAFLHEFAVQARMRGELSYVKSLYEKILRNYPDEIMSLNNLAMLYLDTEPKSPAKALALIEPIINAHPEFLEVYDTRAQIKMEMGDVDASIEDFLKALPVYCLRPEFHIRLANAYRLAKDEPNALIHEELARELSGGSN